MGLMKAIDKFDGAKGYKTITYSVWWIKQSILEAIDKRNGIEHEDLPLDTENSSLFDDDDIEAQPLIGNEFKEDSIESNLNKEDLRSSVETVMYGLSKRERAIVEKYYGITCDKPMTLEEIGKEMNLTKERIRQINDKALKKMKSNALLNSITSDIYI
jgi:RNA polymerase primary sigma factor